MAENPLVEISLEELVTAHDEHLKIVMGIAPHSREYAGEGLNAGQRALEIVGIDTDYEPYIRQILDPLGKGHVAGFLHGFSFATWFFRIHKGRNG